MPFNITTFCENDWEFLDAAEDATYEPSDAAGGLGVTYAVKVLRGELSKPVAFGGRIAMPGTHTTFDFWKANAPNAPDPKDNDLLTVAGIQYVLDGVTDTRRSKWQVAATQVRSNTPAV